MRRILSTKRLCTRAPGGFVHSSPTTNVESAWQSRSNRSSRSLFSTLERRSQWGESGGTEHTARRARTDWTSSEWRSRGEPGPMSAEPARGASLVRDRKDPAATTLRSHATPRRTARRAREIIGHEWVLWLDRGHYAEILLFIKRVDGLQRHCWHSVVCVISSWKIFSRLRTKRRNFTIYATTIEGCKGAAVHDFHLETTFMLFTS